MKRLLRNASLVVALAFAAAWAALGANPGWSKSRVSTTRTDEITGIEHVEWTDKWVPGVDFLAAGLACSAVLLIASISLKPKKNQTPVP